MDYLIVKWLHIGFSTILFGAGIGSAYQFLAASRQRDPAIAAFVTGRVVMADWLFTTPMVVLQPLSGFWLMHLAGWPPGTPWLFHSMLLYGLAIACWLPVVVIQLRMSALARAAARDGVALPPSWSRLLAWWVALGVVAFFAFVAIFYLMVVKPS